MSSSSDLAPAGCCRFVLTFFCESGGIPVSSKSSLGFTNGGLPKRYLYDVYFGYDCINIGVSAVDDDDVPSGITLVGTVGFVAKLYPLP